MNFFGTASYAAVAVKSWPNFFEATPSFRCSDKDFDVGMPKGNSHRAIASTGQEGREVVHVKVVRYNQDDQQDRATQGNEKDGKSDVGEPRAALRAQLLRMTSYLVLCVVVALPFGFLAGWAVAGQVFVGAAGVAAAVATIRSGLHGGLER